MNICVVNDRKYGNFGIVKINRKKKTLFIECSCLNDRLCGLVVRVSGYRYRGPGFDPRRYQIF